jgi:hypothetical protein
MVKYSKNWMKHDASPAAGKLQFCPDFGNQEVLPRITTSNLADIAVVQSGRSRRNQKRTQTQDGKLSFERNPQCVPYEALPGLNKAINMATLTSDEREFFTMFAPGNLKDPQLLMNIVVQERHQMMEVSKWRREIEVGRPIHSEEFMNVQSALEYSHDWLRNSSAGGDYESSSSGEGQSVEEASPCSEVLLLEDCICPHMLLLSKDEA